MSGVDIARLQDAQPRVARGRGVLAYDAGDGSSEALARRGLTGTAALRVRDGEPVAPPTSSPGRRKPRKCGKAAPVGVWGCSEARVRCGAFDLNSFFFLLSISVAVSVCSCQANVEKQLLFCLLKSLLTGSLILSVISFLSCSVASFPMGRDCPDSETANQTTHGLKSFNNTCTLVLATF